MATIFESIKAGDVDAVRSAVRDDPSTAASRNDEGLSAVRAALYAHKHDVADVLLEAKPELDVFDAAAAGDVDRLTELLDGDGDLDVTASFGVASLSTSGGDGKDALVAAADAALYEAKRLGKNRVVTSG